MEGADAGGRVRPDVLTAGGGGPLEEDVDEGVDEGRVGADSGSARIRHPQVAGGLGGLGVEVEDDLHVVGDEAEGGHDDALGPAHGAAVGQVPGGQGLEVVVDVRFEPAGLRRAGARAVDEVGLHRLQAETAGDLGHEDGGQRLVLGDVGDLRGQVGGHARLSPSGLSRAGDVGEAVLVVGALGARLRGGAGLHAQGDRVRDEHEARVRGRHSLLGQGAVGLDDGVNVGLQQAGGVVVGARLVHGELHGTTTVPADPGGGVGLESLTGGAVRAVGEQGDGTGQVLAVLAAPGVGAEGRGGKGQNAAGSGVGQLAQGLADEGVPVAVADDDRQRRAALGQAGLEGIAQLGVARVDRGGAADALVVAGDLHEARVGHAATGGGVAHEGQDVLGAAGPAVGLQENGVVGGQRVEGRDSGRSSGEVSAREGIRAGSRACVQARGSLLGGPGHGRGGVSHGSLLCFPGPRRARGPDGRPPRGPPGRRGGP